MISKSFVPIEDSRRTLAAQVQERIREAILKQTLKAGERIDQNKLAEQLQVSMAPIREALKGLEAEGLVMIQPRRGAFVVEVSISDMDKLYFTRGLIEGEAIYHAVPSLTEANFAELQEMIEKIGRLQNEDLPPVTDQMRETYGMESSSAFQTQIYGALQGVMDALYTAKGQVDDAVSNMASTGQFDAQTDMDVPVDGMDDGMGMEDPTAMDADAGMDADLDNIAGDLDAEDEFGGAAEEEPLGRSKKMESAANLKRKVLEMQKLVEKAKKLREARA